MEGSGHPGSVFHAVKEPTLLVIKSTVNVSNVLQVKCIIIFLFVIPLFSIIDRSVRTASFLQCTQLVPVA